LTHIAVIWCRIGTKIVGNTSDFVETKEVLGGYWMVEADSKEQLVRLMQKCPAEDGDVIEIRQIFSPADFANTT